MLQYRTTFLHFKAKCDQKEARRTAALAEVKELQQSQIGNTCCWQALPLALFLLLRLQPDAHTELAGGKSIFDISGRQERQLNS